MPEQEPITPPSSPRDDDDTDEEMVVPTEEYIQAWVRWHNRPNPHRRRPIVWGHGEQTEEYRQRRIREYLAQRQREEQPREQNPRTETEGTEPSHR